MRKSYVVFAGLAGILAAVVPAAAQSAVGVWPDKPVRIVVPYGPGGPTDIIARILADKLGERSKQTVLIENRPGAGSNTGTAAVARATPDGATLLVNTSAVAVNQTLFKAPGYDAVKDLTAIINVGQSPNVVIASKSLKASTLKDAIAEARTGKLSYGSPGAGTTPNLTMEYLFKVLAKVDVRHVPFKGGSDLMNAALSGAVELGCGAVPTVFAHVVSGDVRGLGVTSAKRIATLPNVPTVAEGGFDGFEDYTWMAVFAPGGMQPDLAGRLNAEMSAILAIPDVRDRLAKIGFEIVGGSQESFAKYLADEVAKWAKVVKAIGATPL
jgi:tripartite-type tricarboxylate transporter receptor subunit TctC